MGKNITLVSEDGEFEVVYDLDEPGVAVEITNKRAAGWATKPEHAAADKAAKKAAQ